MLIKLLSTDITRYWDVILAGLKLSLTKDRIETPEQANNILRAMLVERLSCWFWKEETKIKGIVVTAIMKDEFLGHKNLLIYSIYSHDGQAQDWLEGFETLSKYARARECKNIVFYTGNTKFLRIASHLGAIESYSVCEIPL